MSKLLILTLVCALPTLAQMRVKQLCINGQPQKLTSNIILTAANNDLLLDFDPIKGDSMRYYYRLQPLQSTWTVGHYPSAHFHNLSGGQYTFQIYAKNDSTTTKTFTLPIEVKNAFWQEAWFWPSIAAYVLLIVGIGIYLFFLYDFRQKLKMQHVRNQIASDLHDEVGSNLNSIAIFAELLRQKAAQDPALLPILDRITSNSEETVSLMRDTVWAINPTNDSTEKLLEKMRAFGAEILAAKGVAFDFKADIDPKKVVFTMEQRRNLYLIYKEAINNIAKHASATKASVDCQMTSGKLKMSIADNGQGFAPQQSFEGNGLQNFKRRSEESEIVVNVHSQVGHGTTVTIEVTI